MFIKEVNKCLNMIQKNTTEQNVNNQIDKLVREFVNDYDANDKDVKELKKLKDIKDYNIRRKILSDIVVKYTS